MTRVCGKEKTGIERQQLRLGPITAGCGYPRVLFVGSGLHWDLIRLEGKGQAWDIDVSMCMGVSVILACLLCYLIEL